MDDSAEREVGVAPDISSGLRSKPWIPASPDSTTLKENTMKSFVRITTILSFLLVVMFTSGDAVSQAQRRCQFHQECRGQNVCVAESCVFAYGRDYSVIVMSARGIPTRKPSNAEAWDAFGGLPDPYVFVDIDGVRFRTQPDPDTIQPYWGYQRTVRLNGSSFLRWTLYDHDSTSDDRIVGVNPYRITVDMIRDSEWEDNVGGITVSFAITPL